MDSTNKIPAFQSFTSLELAQVEAADNKEKLAAAELEGLVDAVDMEGQSLMEFLGLHDIDCNGCNEDHPCDECAEAQKTLIPKTAEPVEEYNYNFNVTWPSKSVMQAQPQTNIHYNTQQLINIGAVVLGTLLLIFLIVKWAKKNKTAA